MSTTPWNSLLILFPHLDCSWYGMGRNMASMFPTQLLSQSQLLLSIGKQILQHFYKQNTLNWGKGEEIE